MSSVASVSKPPLQIAQEELARIQAQGIASSHKILDQIEFGCWRKNRADQDRYIHFGQPFIRLLQHDILLDRLDQAANKIRKKMVPEPPKSATDLAIVKLKLGNCGTLTTLAAVEVSKFCDVLTPTFSDSSIQNTHGFCILGTESDLKNCQTGPKTTLGNILEMCPNAVILDPFLELAIPVSEMSTQGKKLTQYMKLWDVVCLQDCAWIPERFPTGELLEQAEQIYQKLRLVDLTEISVRTSGDNLAALNELFYKYVGPQSASALKQWFSGTEWTVAVNEKAGTVSLSMNGTDETTKPVSDKLKAIGMSAKRFGDKKTKTRYQVVLIDPHAAQVRVAASISQIFQNNLLKLILSYVL